MGKTRDFSNKIGDTKGTFHAKMGTIKDRNSKDLTEEEEIKKRRQEYTGELYKKGLNDPGNHDAVVTHLEPDILECEVKWVLGSITMNKVSKGDCQEPARDIPLVTKVMRIFFYCSVYSCHLFFISSASVRSILFLSFIVPIFA